MQAETTRGQGGGWLLLVLALLGFTGSVSVARYIRGFDDIEDEEDGA